jgi:ATP-dependent DNA helicase RecQ
LNDSEAETLRRFQRGESVDEIARARGFVQSTIYGHLAAAVELGKLAEHARFFTATQETEIAAAFNQVRDGKLVDVGALLGNRYDIGLLRIFRAFAARAPFSLDK